MIAAFVRGEIRPSPYAVRQAVLADTCPDGDLSDFAFQRLMPSACRTLERLVPGRGSDD